MNESKRNHIIKKIKSKGYWEINIFPSEYKEDRIELNKLQQVIEKSKVSLRGWDYPHVFGKDDENEKGPYSIQTGKVLCIEKYIDWDRMIEFWRFTQSANFYHIFAIREDHDYYSKSFGKHLSIFSTLYTISEIFEFTRRLFTENIFTPSLKIEINLYDLNERTLVTQDPRVFIPPIYKAISSNWSYSKEFDIKEFAKENLENLILDAFSKLVFMFNWKEFSIEGFRNNVRKFLSGKII